MRPSDIILIEEQSNLCPSSGLESFFVHETDDLCNRNISISVILRLCVTNVSTIYLCVMLVLLYDVIEEDQDFAMHHSTLTLTCFWMRTSRRFDCLCKHFPQ